MTIIAGIDLGLSGAIAALDAEARRILWIEDMPTLEIIVGKKARRTIDLHRLLNLLQSLSDTGCTLAVVEEPGFRPSQMGMGTIGYGFGLVMMGCFCTDPAVRTETVQPSGWKASLRVPAEKSAAVKRAVTLFPAHAHLFYGSRGGPLDGRAESAMIGLYGAQRFLGIRN